jgi:hypothetical protein
MGINAGAVKGGNNDNRVTQPNIEPGVYPGRLVQVIDLGVQPQRPYQGKDKPPAQEIMITHELVDEFIKDENGDDVEGKPRWVSENFVLHSLKADMAKSTKRYHAFDPEEHNGGDWGKLVGMPINITIVNNKNGDKVYDNVANLSAMRPKDAANCPELVNPTKVFDLDDPDMEVFASLPKWIQEKLTSNLNYKGSPLEEKLANTPQEASKEDKKPKNRKPVVEEADDEDTPY